MFADRSLSRGSDIRLFGLCDLGFGSPELSSVMLNEVEDGRGKFGLPVERDLYFKAEHRLSTTPRSPARPG